MGSQRKRTLGIVRIYRELRNRMRTGPMEFQPELRKMLGTNLGALFIKGVS